MKEKIRSKYILLLFVSMIVLFFGGIFFTVQQEKEGPITAEAASVYWGSQSIPTTCPSCGEANADLRLGSYSSSTSCEITLNHYVNNPGGGGGSFVRCRTTIILHSPVSVPKREPTCTTNGNWAYTYCGKCHAYATSVTTIPALGHDYGEWVVAQPASCTQGGTEQRACQRSGCSARETRAIEATGHTWDSGTVTLSATCQRTGTRKYECTACGETKTETIAKRSHNYNIYLSRVEPTCTASGRTAGYECQWCYANTCSTIPALGHDLEHHDGQPATCTEIGWNDYETCNRAGCDYTTYREIAATGHTPGAAATCTTPQTCTECGAILVEALGHKTVSHLGQDPTCTAEGWKPYETCENCDYTTYEIIPALGHSFTNYVSDNNATCTEDGTETAKCDRCDVTDTRTDEGSALGHDWAEKWTTDGTSHWHECNRCDEINDKANHSGGTATCIELAECEICGAEYGDFAEHVYVENAEERYLVSEATCTAKATYYKSCSVCGEAGEEIFEFGDPLGHSYGEPEWTWEGYTSATAKFTCAHGCGDVQTVAASGGSITSEITTPAECEKEGLRTYTAKVLFGGEEYITTTAETLESLGHSFTSYVSNNDATCTEDGTETAKCDRCNVTDTRTDDGSALGHDWAEEWTTDGTAHWHECSRCDEINGKANHSGGTATCTEPAECEVCGVAYGEALGHDLQHHDAQAATCTEIGWNAYDTCSRCDYTTYEEIPALGHTEGEAVRENEVDATCTVAGSYDEVVYCSVCGEELSREEKTIEALGHSFTSYASNNDATCTEDGTETAKCDRCEVTDTRTDEGSALGHDWAVEWTTDGTSHWHKCSRCNEINDKANHSGGTATCIAHAKCEICGAEYGDFAEHVYVENAEERYLVSEATCTAKATYYKSCSVCGEAGEEIFEFGDPLGHSYGEPDWTWEDYTSATATFTCTREDCGDKQTATASGSSITSVVTTPAECEAEGMRTYNAKVMFGGEEYVTTTTETLEALGHDLEHHEAKPATCTEIGWKAYDTCTRCDYTTYVEIEALGHTEGEAVRENEVPASCTVAGSYDEVVYCSVCGEELSREKKTIEALGHSFTSYVSDNNATCVEDGTETAQCDRCEVTDTRTDEGSALGHDWAEEWTTDGTAHWHECSRCDEINDKANHSGGTATCIALAKCEICGVEYGSALGHDLEHHEAKPASCTEIGWEAYDTCTRCDYTTYVEIPAKGHAEGEVVRENEVPASCTTAGSYDEVIYCSVCGEELSREEKVIDALGHSFTNYVSDNNATCTEDGTETAKCDRCEVTDTRTDEGSALGHTESEAVRENEVPASCTAAGSYDEVIYCSVCGEELSREEKVIDALGHSFTNYVSDNNATCTEDGTETAKCDRCEVTDTRTDEGSALGHTESEAVRENEVPASCTAAGSYDEVIYCSVCGEELSREEKVIDALGHSFTNYVSDNNATCTEDGTETAKCDCCEVTDTKTDEGSALGHNWAEEWTTDGTSHWHECSRCDEINDKANHSGGTATCIALAKCEICGVEYGDFAEHNYVDGYCTVCGIIDGAALDNDKDDAKTDLDDIAQDAKDEIDGSDLPDDVKDDLKDKIDEIINGAKDEVEGSTDFDDVGQAVENAKDEIEDAILDAEKDDAKSDLDEIAQGAKDEVDGSDLPDDVKDDLKDKIDEIVNDAKTEIDGASSKDEIEESFSEAESGIEEVNKEALENAKEDVLAELEELAQSIKDEINGSNLSDGAKNQLKNKIDEIIENANSELESKTTFDEVYELGDVIKSEISAVKEEAITIAKEEAVAALETYVESAKNEIAASDLSTEEQADHTGQIDAEAESTKEEIVAATDFETIANALKEAMEEIDRIQAIGHIAGPAATCTTPQVCTVCGKELAPALDHDEIEHDGQPATCTEAGWADYVTCSRCDYSTYQTIPALGHTESDPVRENVVEASCTAAGSYDEVVYCSVCGEELSREEKVIDALGHDIVKHEGQAATCTQNGWNDYETCSRCDYTTYREIAATGHTPGAAATCTSAQRCTVCGTTLVSARGHHFVDGYCSVCGAIDGTALDNDKDDAKTDLDDIAQDAKDEIDGSDLPDDVKEDLKDKVDEIINGAKDEVEGSTDFDDIDQAVENTKDEIEDAILDAEKDDAKSDLDEIAQGAKDEVDGSDLPDDVKDDLKDKIDEIVNDAKTEIDGETSKEEVDQTVEDAQQEIEDAILNAEKDDAKSDLDKIAQSAKDEIGSSGISDEEKAELKDKVDAAIEDAKEAIDNATSKEEVENIVNDTREDIDDLLKGSLDNELAEKKDAAISDLTEIAQDAKDGIDGSDISDEEKDELKGKVDEIVNDAKDEIEGAVTPEEIDEILAEAENEIAAVTEDLKAGQLNTSTLWPWIIVAIVISAALSTLFAWRHVKKVQGKGEAVGAKSVVTIAVATILIFVVVIGITLLIFAMV